MIAINPLKSLNSYKSSIHQSQTIQRIFNKVFNIQVRIGDRPRCLVKVIGSLLSLD